MVMFGLDIHFAPYDETDGSYRSGPKTTPPVRGSWLYRGRDTRAILDGHTSNS